MTQTNDNPLPVRSPSPGPLTYQAVIALIATLAAGPATIGMLCWTENPWVSLAVLLVILGGGNAAWAANLVENNWRRAHWLFWLAWLPNAWLSGSCALIAALVWMESQAFKIDEAYVVLAAFAGIPAVCMLAALMLRSLRSEVALMAVLLLPALLGIMGVGVLLYFETHPDQNEYGIGTLLGALIIAIAAAQALPLIVALGFLLTSRRWGTRPVKIATCLYCEYVLTGSVHAGQNDCPECGSPIPQAQSAWIQQNP
jgi:hypothetical protein